MELEKVKFKIVKKLRKELEEIGEIGDYFGNWVIAKDLGNDLYNELVLIHEFIEYYLISKAGLSWREIDLFDENKEYKRKHLDRYKKYRQAHRVALSVEKKICKFLEVDFNKYQDFVEKYGGRN